MRIIRSVKRMVGIARQLPRPAVLVPTMGALHEGHLALVDRARRLAGTRGTTVTSIFVNPTQFGPREDFSKYPRPFSRDCQLLREHNCDIVFAPTAKLMYAPGASVTVTESQLSTAMCGASRPGHFTGVCTVVAKLFQIVQPDFAIFGEKDFQQLAIIRRMTRDLNFGVRIIGHPTVREPDGLALSSRNVYLGAEERGQAPLIRQTLLEAESKLRKELTSLRSLESWIRSGLERASLAKIDYVAVVDPETLQPKEPNQFPVLLAVAVFFGTTRLIDNLLVK
ncbi:MAG TPA: pantoate--beta-alanine ligase [Chthoniobacterales bacterium]|nr:pantoate--beta-alanine ligase [Chthoniobacterales bacterium]